jgi:anti-sigma-K factor RskA
MLARLFEDIPLKQTTRKERFRGWLRWRVATGLIVAAVLVLAFLYWPGQEVEPDFRAELQPEQREFVLRAEVFTGATVEVAMTRDAGPPAPADRATELWAIPEGGAPVSLGILPAAAEWRVTLPPGLVDELDTLTLALSDEPQGGSPTGAPTGEFLAEAPLAGL